jgi:hypothetical protein
MVLLYHTADICALPVGVAYHLRMLHIQLHRIDRDFVAILPAGVEELEP